MKTALRVMTFNIRYDTPEDGENAWSHRRAFVAEVIQNQRPDLLGVQEALLGQVHDLHSRLPSFYAWVGVGRDDGREAGEFSPIFFNEQRFELLKHGTFWLSKSPDLPGSVGWDAAHPRIVTWAKFRDTRTSHQFYHFNAHWDHRGAEARRESARLLLQKIGTIADAMPVIVTGDLNCGPHSRPYQMLTESDPQSGAGPLKDAHQRDDDEHPPGTCGGFYVTDPHDRRIDYIFVHPDIDVKRYEIVRTSREGRYPSDHWPVVADLLLP